MERATPDGFSSAPYVRREESERWCEAAITAVTAGEGHVALVVGEPGIGKTRLLRELGSRAVARGVDVSIGRGWEGSSVPFAPLCQALSSRAPRRRRARGGRVDGDRDVLEWLLGGGVVRSLRLASRDVPTGARLASRVARAVLGLARRRPTLLVLDDLQWVDHATLEAFELLAFALADAQTAGDALPFVLVGSLRPPTPEQRVARTLARLQRESACSVLPLAAFDEDEVAELLSSLGVGPATHQMVAMVHEATGGNPLFALEVVRHLRRTSAVKRQGRFFTIAPGAIEVPLPADIRAAVQKRTEGMDAKARDVITLGAILGDPFEISTLRAAARMRPAAFDAMLDGWITAALVVSDGTRVQFAHPLIRQALLAALPSPRRKRLHADIADTLAHLSGRSAVERRLEIAHHLAAAGPAADRKQLIAECTRAGELAGARHAWTNAARFYEAALAAAERHPLLLDERRRGDLHFRAGFANYRDQDAGSCLAHFEAAISASRAAGDLPGVARALLGRIRARFTLVSVSYGASVDTDDLESVVEQIAEQEPLLAAFSWSEMAQVLWTAQRPAEARVFAERALAVGTGQKSPMVAAEAHRALSLISSQQLDPHGALDHLEAGLAWARRGQESWIESQILQRMILPLLWLGKTDRIETIATAATASTQVIHDWGDHSLAHGALTCWAVARGDFDGAERHAREALRLLNRSGYPWAGPTALPALALARMLRGAWTEADEALSLLETPGQVFAEPGPDVLALGFFLRQVLVASRSPHERLEVRERLEMLMPRVEDAARNDIYALGPLGAAVECAEVIAAPTLASTAYELLTAAHARGVVLTTGWVSLVPRVLAVAATLMERWDDAETWFEKALQSSRELDLPAEHARTAIAYAGMLTRRCRSGDRARGLELLALAAPQLRELGMTPLFALVAPLANGVARPATPGHPHRATEQISAVGADGGPLLAIMFTDIEDSTETYTRLGDTAGRALVRAHDAVVRDWLDRCSGTLMKHTGDGILAAFSSVQSALDCAVAMQRDFARHTRRHPHRPLRVRIGINIGQPLAEEGDLFGTAVNAAARVCARAKGGQILVTQALQRLAETQEIRFVPRKRVTLRGLRSPIRLFEVAWNGDPRAARRTHQS